jgi:hypothetical protein
MPAPIERTFAYFQDPGNTFDHMEVVRIEHLEGGRRRIYLRDKGVRRPRERTREELHVVPNRLVVCLDEENMFLSLLIREFAPMATGTWVTITAAYTMAVPFVGRVLLRLIPGSGRKHLLARLESQRVLLLGSAGPPHGQSE